MVIVMSCMAGMGAMTYYLMQNKKARKEITQFMDNKMDDAQKFLQSGK